MVKNYIWTLDAVQKHAEMVAGLWDGDNPGKLEDGAHAANELLDALKTVRELLAEIEDFDESDVMSN